MVYDEIIIYVCGHYWFIFNKTNNLMARDCSSGLLIKQKFKMLI